MAKSTLERKRESLDRKRIAVDAMLEATRGLQAEPFFEFYRQHSDEVNVRMALDTAGLPFPELDNDSDPKSTTGSIEEFVDYTRYGGSIGRAELIVAAWSDAAQELASIINDYKTKAAKAALAELESKDLSDPAVRKKALAESARLDKILNRLEKTLRISIPAYEVKGV